jgi:hypothetical protein
VKATAGQIRQWKRELKTHPDDPETRARLLGATLLALNFMGEGLREALDPKRAR